jgi:rubrerythrin
MTDVQAFSTDGLLAPEGGATRAAVLKRAAIAFGATAGAGGAVTALPRIADSARADERDTRILNFVLRLEYLKAAFYEQAAQGGVTGELQRLAQVLARHERRHVTFLRKRLGRRAVDEPPFDFGDATSDADAFASAARTLEEAAVAAYIGQGAHLSRRNMVPFAQITSVEARHAAWIADILGRPPAPLAADEAKSPAAVRAEIDRLGFEAR